MAVVRPEPEQQAIDHPTAAFVIIAQHVPETACPAFITVQDGGDLWHQAVLLPRNIAKRATTKWDDHPSRSFCLSPESGCHVSLWGVFPVWTAASQRPPVSKQVVIIVLLDRL